MKLSDKPFLKFEAVPIAKMQRQHFRPPHPAAGPRGGGFRTPPHALDRPGGGRFPSPPWAFPNGPYGPRFGSYGGSPGTHTQSREFSGNRGGGSGMYDCKSAGQTPRRSNGSPTYRHSPYQSPGAHSGYQVETQSLTKASIHSHREKGTQLYLLAWVLLRVHLWHFLFCVYIYDIRLWTE